MTPPWTSTRIATPKSGRVFADLVKGSADLAERGIEVGPLGYAVGPHLHPGRADVVREPHVLLGPLDVLPHDRRVGRLVLECAPEAGQCDRRIFEPLAHVIALGLRQAHLDLVGVRRPQLDALVAQLLEPREDRGQVPVLGDVVGDDPELSHGASFRA